MSENLDPYTYWENRYSAGRTWSGNVNAALEREAVHVMHNAGRIRIAVHGYNTSADIDRVLASLAAALA